MKRTFKTIAATFALLTIATVADAAFYFGGKAGVNSSRVRHKSGDYTIIYNDYKTGVLIGPTIELTFMRETFGLEASALYSKRGDDEWEQKGIEVPLNLRYYFFDLPLFSFFGSAGPDFYFNMNDDDNGLEKKSAEVSLSLGGGVKVASIVDVGVNYLIPLGDNFETSIGDYDVRIRTWQFFVAIKL